jgi:hypothetical protein
MDLRAIPGERHHTDGGGNDGAEMLRHRGGPEVCGLDRRALTPGNREECQIRRRRHHLSGSETPAAAIVWRAGKNRCNFACGGAETSSRPVRKIAEVEHRECPEGLERESGTGAAERGGVSSESQVLPSQERVTSTLLVFSETARGATHASHTPAPGRSAEVDPPVKSRSRIR